MTRSKYLASPDDGAEILRILESSAARGQIELIYTRRTDAYASYMKENGEAHVFVSRSGERIVATCAEIVGEVYIGGRVCRAAYVCGLKKDAGFEGNAGFNADFIRELADVKADCYYCSVIADNVAAERMFKKPRRILSTKEIVGYRVFVFSPKIKIKTKKHSLLFRRATKEDEKAVVAFLNDEGKRKDMFPVVRDIGQFYNLHTEDFYLLTDGKPQWNTAKKKRWTHGSIST